MNSKSVLLIAGEISGDMHAATVVREILKRQPDIKFFGVGGDELRKMNMEILYDTKDTAVLGLADVLLKIRFFRKMFKDILEQARMRKPDAVLLVDYPGFNLRFAKKAHSMGLKVIYYICPQVWAWRRKRIAEMAQNVDSLISIFPFESEVFNNSGLEVNVVKHPLVDTASAILKTPHETLPWNGSPKIALLPGSRIHEVKRMLPVMLGAARILAQKRPGSDFIIAAPNEDIAALAKTILKKAGGDPRHLVVGKTREILRQASAAWVASGTATVEAAMMRCPMAVIYKTAWTTYLAGRALIKVPWLGMVNIIAGKSLCPELIQHKATPSNLVSALLPMLDEENTREEILRGLDEIKMALSGEGDDAADIVLRELEKNSSQCCSTRHQAFHQPDTSTAHVNHP